MKKTIETKREDRRCRYKSVGITIIQDGVQGEPINLGRLSASQRAMLIVKIMDSIQI